MQDHKSAATGHLPAGDRATKPGADTDLQETARALRIGPSSTPEDASARELRERQREAWLKENRDAIEAYNEDVAHHGVFSSGLRGF